MTLIARRTAVSASMAARWGLLPSRIEPPVARDSDVARDGLVSSLIECRAPIVSVIAPSGYGKSTLMAQFAERDSRPIAWLNLAPDVDDQVTFARYLAYSLDRIVPIDEDLLNELDAIRPRIGRVSSGLVAAIHATEEPFALVVDDVHLLRDRGCVSMLRTIAREVPPGALVAVVARHETSLPLGRARASGMLFELGVDDLRFGLDDAARLLRGAGASDLDAEVVERLAEQTEGWAVGLYLAARSLVASPAAPSFAGDDRYVADYLRETMLADLPSDEVDFLIRTSVLEELSGPLCDAVLEMNGSGAMLEDLEKSNLLVVPLDRRRERFRYHHLFRDLLRMELGHRSPELLSTLTARASAWCEQQGSTDQAVAYAIDGHLVDRVAELIARYGQAAYYGGRASVVASWRRGSSGSERMARSLHTPWSACSAHGTTSSKGNPWRQSGGSTRFSMVT